MFALRHKGKAGRREVFQLFKEMREGEKDPSGLIRLDAFVFQTVLRVLHCTDEPESATSSLHVLMTMLLMFDGGRQDLAANQVCMDACLSTAAECGDASVMQHGLRLLEEIQKRHSEGRLSALPSEDVVTLLHTKAS